MGSSSKKKKEKKKDFQKPKLKVGKAKPKAANFTDTSFRSKAIVLNQQSLGTSAPSSTSQFTHHLSLLTHRSDSQRKDSLAYLTTVITSRPVNTPLPQPVSIILPKLQPLVLDASNGVRSQLLKLLRALPQHDIEDHTAQMLPFIRAGMTHLAADIRLSTVDVLSWLLEVAGQDVVSSSGGWVKTMKCFLSVLGWHTDDTGKWSSNRPSFGKAGSEGKSMVKTLQVLTEFLRAGIGQYTDPIVEESASNQAVWAFPLWHTQQHLLPQKSNAFGHLNLFGIARDEETEMYEDRDDRIRVFVKMFQVPVETGLEAARKEGGEVGRVAAMAGKVLKDGLEGQGLD